jgi:putative glutamine amidotransferase
MAVNPQSPFLTAEAGGASVTAVHPRIGLTASVMPTRLGTRRTFLNEPYIVAIQEAGGIPLMVTPAHGGPPLRALFELLDGLVLTGGEDVAPERYGEEVLRPNVEVVPERDALEFTLLEWALAEDLPVLAICRGVQVLNVGLGGTLYQDLAADRSAHFVHDQALGESPRPRTEPHHAVALRPGSGLADLLAEEQVEVNSMHHQGIKSVAPPLAAVAHAPDGLVEGVEPTDPARWSFLVGVQWHPEELARAGHAPSRRLFERFVAAAAKRARR